ncbi:hypothetical protein UFOVP276_125 [uncultured Caudovirales phage]|uniref:Uncharacterized protein n=1 Tax=uncultured Caudovirales phage TaxID=2100421 RepID=A0A6J5LU07_9CAUD|nr:hypothetical protein UFOVP127_19 [uncultured Caudovirales phage]CAB4135169.1 hypothetical protein UFOVP276_125 [uncultured Caudovirales phage]
MSIPTIRTTTHTVVVDNAGRNDLIIGTVVTCTDINAANTGHVYNWGFVDKPIGSVAAITGVSSASCSFTPDVTGTYFIRCTVDGTSFSEQVLGVPLAHTGARIPAFGEQTEYNGYGNTKGWHEALTTFMRVADQDLLGSIGPQGIQGPTTVAQSCILASFRG